MATDRAEAAWRRVQEAARAAIVDLRKGPYAERGKHAELAAKLGIKPPSLTAIMDGGKVGPETVFALAELLEGEALDVYLDAFPSSGKADARRWFLHRIKHEHPLRVKDAETWLATAAPAYTGHPVSWNSDLKDSFDAWWQDRATQVDRAAEILSMPVPDSPLRGGRVLFLQHVARTKPEQLADAEDHAQRFKAAAIHGENMTAEDVCSDIQLAFKRDRKVFGRT